VGTGNSADTEGKFSHRKRGWSGKTDRVERSRKQGELDLKVRTATELIFTRCPRAVCGPLGKGDVVFFVDEL